MGRANTESDGPSSRVTIQDPIDGREFREALTTLLSEAEENNVDINNRFWACKPGEVDLAWDVEIITLSEGDDN